jgi:hypothetical protein
MQFRRLLRGALRRPLRSLPLLAFTAFCSVQSATTLVAVWTPDQLVIGADSSVITTLGGRAVKTSACKINQEGSTFYAFSGLVEDQGIEFNVATLAQRAVQSGAGLADRVERFKQITREPLARAVARLKSDSPDDYEYLRRGHPALQAIFADVQPGAPSLAIAEFSVSPDGSLAMFGRMVADGDDGRGPRIIYAGQQSHIREYLTVHSNWYTGDGSELARKLVELEIASSDGKVGGPVDVLKLRPHGAQWVQRKPECSPLNALLTAE